MSLDHLTSFFLRFKDITPPDERVRKCTCEFVKKEIGVIIPFKNVSVKGVVIYIETKPTIKNEIFMRKQELISFLQKEIQKETLYDIR